MFKNFFQKAEEKETATAEGVVQFTTNLRCGACVQKVAPMLDALDGVERWEVALEKPERVLTIYGAVDADAVEKGMQEAGYTAEKV